MRECKKILVVDDELEHRNTLSELLQDEYEVEAVDDSLALQMLNENMYDLVILDIMMKTKNGMQVYEELRAFDQHSLVIVYSALDHDDANAMWVKDKGLPFISKSEASIYDKIVEYIKEYKFKEAGDISLLIVDDEKDKQDTYAELLEEIGIVNVTKCSSIEEAEAILSNKSFDIYIVDICFNDHGQLKPVGQNLVSLLVKNNRNSRSIIVPITAKEIGREILAELVSFINVKPFFYEEPASFSKSINYILMKGPFTVQHV